MISFFKGERMNKKLISAILIVAGLILPSVATANPSQGESYTEVASGKYYMMPRSAWLKEETIPMKYVQVFWFLEATGLGNATEITISSPTKNIKAWGEVRKDAFRKMVSRKLLTKTYLSSSHPKEFYYPGDWNRLIQQYFLHRGGKTYEEYCKARLVVRAFKADGARGGDLKWWDEFTIPLVSGSCPR